MYCYDFLIIGSGLFGAVCANELKKAGKRCLVIDRRSHTGGNLYCDNIGGINVHKYGAHIFHTNDKKIWDYVNSHVEFNRFTHMPMANVGGDLYNLPFNMNTFYQLWKTKSPEEAKKIIHEQIKSLNIKSPRNLEEQALSMVGKDIYNKFIKGYTEKQWGRPATELPSFIIKRIPVRFTYDNRYFDDKYQGIPIGGYNKLISSLLRDIECRTNVDYFKNRYELNAIAEKIICTSQIDAFYDYKFGPLAYRSLRFDTEHLHIPNFQGNAVVNFTCGDVPYTRIIEHKHFEFGEQSTTVITKEYPIEECRAAEPYYPINDIKNNSLYKKYSTLAENEKRIFFGGRLAEYRYYDMHQVIGSALSKISRFLDRS